MTTVTIVTPWRDHPELAGDYWAAMNAGRPDEVLVIDNGSTPFLRFPQSNCDGYLIRREENLGFARASNIGLRKARSDAVLFVNNDVVMTGRDWLGKLTAAFEPGVLVGASLRFDAHGQVDGRGFPYLDGWCVGGMRDDLVALGGFDESFDEPAYFSDNDLSFRARTMGMRLREVRVGLVHKGNRTAGPGSQPHVVAVSRANFERFAAKVRATVAA